ncbi:MAG: PAS domain S-box protein [Melioribacteraceae bacterium]|nr:PAS domain S-box protein [Melioribacteraceae bacterium]
MKPTIKVLILEDNQDDINILLHELNKEFDVIHITTDKKDEYIYELATFAPDIIISDYTMPSFNGMEALLYKEKVFPFIPFIIVTGSINEETAVKCIKSGADDYIIKNRPERLNSAVKQAIEKRKTQLLKIEAEEKYKNVFENTLVGLYRTTPEGKILLANPTLLKMIGYESFEELANRNLEREGFEPSYPRSLFKEKIEKENELVGLESAWTRKDGSILYVRESAKAIRDAYGNIKYYDGVVEDITEQVLAKQKLEKQYATLNSIINSPKDIIIFSLDRNYCYTSFNEKHKYEMKKVWNTDIEIGMNILELMTIPELREKAKESMDRVLSGESIYEIQEQINLGIYYEFNWNPIYSDNEIIGLTVFVRDISEQKKYEIELIKSEQRFHSTFENMQEGCQIISHDWTYLFVNKVAVGYIGKPKEEIIGKKYYEVHPEVIEQGDFYKLEKAMKERTFYEEEYHHCLNNISRYFHVRVHPVPEGLLVLSKDITEAKKVEKEIEEKEKHIQMIFNTANEGICLSDKEMIIKLVNPKFASLLGYEINELIDKPFVNLVPEKFKKIFFEKVSERRIGKSDIYEFQLKKKDNSLIWFLVSASPLFDENGNYKGSLGMFTDISNWKKTEIDLQKFYTGIEQSSSYVVITDINANIEYVNPAFTKITGYEKEEVLGKNPRILKSGNKSKEEYRQMWNKISSGNSWHGEFLNKKKNGEFFWDYATISPIFDESGNIIHYIQISDDITERKKMINDLIEAKEKAEEMNRIKTNFFANMSHELRTPFVGILGSAEILKEMITDEESISLVDAIIRSSKRLTDTLNKILSLSKIEFNEIQVNKTRISVNYLLNDTFNLFKNSYDKRFVEYSLKELEKDILIESDEKILRGILINLISNAIKFTPKGEITVSANLISKQSKNILQLKVTDTGIGIPKEKQELIFEAFRQASEGINRSFEGTGLGLTIVKKYVELLEGNISLISDVGLGSTFLIEIPVQVVESNQQDINLKEEKMNEEIVYQKTTTPKKLLYVEDDEFSQNIVVKSLKKFYSIELVTNAHDALNKIKNENYDALLIDINLGYGMDGVQLAEQIKKNKNYREIPIIAVTAYASEQDKEEFLSRGFTHYISKPFSIKDLIQLVASVFYKEEK